MQNQLPAVAEGCDRFADAYKLQWKINILLSLNDVRDSQMYVNYNTKSTFRLSGSKHHWAPQINPWKPPSARIGHCCHDFTTTSPRHRAANQTPVVQKVFPVMQRVFPVVQKVFPVVQVFPIVQKVFPAAQVLLVLQEVFGVVQRVFPIVQKVFPVVQKVFAIEEKVFPVVQKSSP